MSDLELIVQHYRAMLDEMQGKTFFVQDDDGVLRRWYPPKRSILDREDQT